MDRNFFHFFLNFRGVRAWLWAQEKLPKARSKAWSAVARAFALWLLRPPWAFASAEVGAIVWEQRTFSPADLAGVFLVIAATPSPDLHEQIFQQAQRDGIFCNAVDEPERCDFYYPAVAAPRPTANCHLHGGRAPLIAQRLRQELERNLAPNTGLGSRRRARRVTN